MTILINAQWQGSGRGERYPIGAERLKRILASQDLLVPGISYHATARQAEQGVINSEIVRANFTALETLLRQRQVTDCLYNLGCDCSGEIIPIAYLNEIHGGNLKVLWFDAHPDLNTTKADVARSMHGMALRTILGEGPAAFRHFVRMPVRPENVILLGARSIDPGEETCIAAKRIRTISPADMARPPSEILPDEQLGQGPIFVHVDYDVLDPDHHPHTAFPEPGGLDIDVLTAWLASIRGRANVVGWGLTEYAPAGSDGGSEDVEKLLSDGFGLPLH